MNDGMQQHSERIQTDFKSFRKFLRMNTTAFIYYTSCYVYFFSTHLAEKKLSRRSHKGCFFSYVLKKNFLNECLNNQINISALFYCLNQMFKQ